MYLVVDTETGGKTPDQSLLEISATILDDRLKEAGSFLRKVKPDDGVYKVMGKALSINGISLADHDQIAQTYSDCGRDLELWLKQATILSKPNEKLLMTGWNVTFDRDFVLAHLLKKPVFDSFCGYGVLDLSSVAAFMRRVGKLPATANSLKKVAEHLGISTIGHHSAQADVAITISVFKKMLFL
jgi:DNA polymerase III epsilon subunit-like protein